MYNYNHMPSPIEINRDRRTKSDRVPLIQKRAGIACVSEPAFKTSRSKTAPRALPYGRTRNGHGSRYLQRTSRARQRLTGARRPLGASVPDRFISTRSVHQYTIGTEPIGGDAPRSSCRVCLMRTVGGAYAALPSALGGPVGPPLRLNLSLFLHSHLISPCAAIVFATRKMPVPKPSVNRLST